MAHRSQLKNEKYRDWVKAVLGLKYLKEGLEGFCDTIAKQQHADILKKVKEKQNLEEVKCGLCKLQTLKPDHVHTETKQCQLGQEDCNCRRPRGKIACTNKVCGAIYDEIIYLHGSTPPSPYWKNTDITKWCTDPLAVAKCYINANGYAEKLTMSEIDLPGLLHLIINNTGFHSHIKDTVVFHEVRRFRNTLFHSDKMELERDKANGFIDDMIAVLEDDVELKHRAESQEAIKKLLDLKDEAFVITSTNEDEAYEQKKKYEDTYPEPNVSFWFCEWYRTKHMQRRLREDLISFYRRHHSTLPVSPLIENYDVPLLDLHVQTKLLINFRFKDSESIKTQITSYKDLLLYGQDCYKEIYVTAKSGAGKTSFSKRLCIVWCQSHSPDKSLREKIKKENVSTLKRFEYLFMIPLKETGLNECKIEDIVFSMIETHLPKCYSRSFVNNILYEKQVLIILDGLDEWAHPDRCRKTEIIPHRLSYPKCSIITTTRQWKLAAANLRDSQIDVHAEIQELDESTSKLLIESAVKILNKNSKESKSPDDFEKILKTLKLGPLKFIPYTLLQLICLWYDNQHIGKSKCEIYSSAVELTLTRRNKKDTKINTGSKNIPSCLNIHKLCTSHYGMLIDLGKLAFETLLSSETESTLVFDENVVKSHGVEENLDDFLVKGLLVESKIYGHTVARRRTFTFLHKSIQEYFAALYIQSCPDSKDIGRQILNIHKTKEDLLQMSNVFTFLGGFNPSTCGHILQMLQDAVSGDEKSLRYRTCLSGQTSLPECRRIWEGMKSFQTMQIDIVREISCGELELPFYVEDIIIDDSIDKENSSLLKRLLKIKNGYIKSLDIEKCRSTQGFTKILETFKLHNVKSLDKLVINAVPREEDLALLLSGSANTLKCLDICFALFKRNHYQTEYTEISSKTVGSIFEMNLLHSVRLNSIRLTHDNIKTLFDFVIGRSNMTEVGLCHIWCKDHADECNRFLLDLSQHQKLETLRLGSLPLEDIRLNSTSLKYCYTGTLSDDVHLPLSKALSDASNLSTLRLKFLSPEQLKLYNSGILSKMVHLRFFAIEIPDIECTELILPPELKIIERVVLYKVLIEYPDLKKLVESADYLPQPVTIELKECTVTPYRKYQTWKNQLESSPNYLVKFDRTDGNRHEFSFETRKRSDEQDKKPENGNSSSFILMLLIFGTAVCLLSGIFFFLPEFTQYERHHMKMPRDIEDAKNLGKVFSSYTDNNYWQVLTCYIVTYIVLQSVGIPGSMCLGILSGFLFQFCLALFMVCLCTGIGKSFGYLLPDLVGRPFVMKYRPNWKYHVNRHREYLLNYIVFLRLPAVLPNWFIDIVLPRIDVPMMTFFIGTILGSTPTSLVAIQAGKTLHQLIFLEDGVPHISIIVLTIFALISILPNVYKKKRKTRWE